MPLRDPPPHLTPGDETLAPDRRAIVTHCLEKDAGNRFQTTRDLAFALRMRDSRTPSEPAAFTWYWAVHSQIFASLRASSGFARVLAKVVPA